MALSSSQKNWAVFFAAIATVGAAAAAFLGAAGNTDDNIALLLRASAQAAFLVLLLVFVARPLQQLLVSPGTSALLRNRRLLGVAFAGIHTAHLGLILYRDNAVPEFEFSVRQNLPGGLTYLFIYLMLITSFDRPARAIGRTNWKVLHKFGLFWVFLAFLPTLIPESREQLFGAQGVLIFLAAGAVVVRVTAFAVRRFST